VGAIQDWIRSGDVYQVNLSRRLEFAPASPALARRLYADLATRAPAPFAAYLEGGDHVVVSNSPERFLRTVGARVETCPIKGTRPRGRHPEEDRWLAKELLASAKDRAEHVMIVDLERNDLGRVCEIGSVRVDRLAALRTYPTVHHLVSSVQGCLRDPGDLTGLLRATFPGGSITGAPKIRAMEIIDSLESGARGVYTGAIGMIDAAGDIDLSIAIRTAVVARGRLSLHVGGGIVADSDADEELQETRDKASAFVRLRSREA
jgi:para-aminobenzoate synthetase component 1